MFNTLSASKFENASYIIWEIYYYVFLAAVLWSKMDGRNFILRDLKIPNNTNYPLKNDL